MAPCVTEEEIQIGATYSQKKVVYWKVVDDLPRQIDGREVLYVKVIYADGSSDYVNRLKGERK
jgi:hypothetical protein